MVMANGASDARGWPVVPFEKVAIAQSDRGQRLKQRDYLAEGAIPVIDQGQALVGGYTDDEGAAFVGDLPVVLFGDHTRAVKLIHHRFAVGADGIKIFRPAEGVRAKYLYYWMKSAHIPDRGYGRHYQYLRALSVPLPPTEKQDEIVAEIEKQFSRLDEAVANLKRVKANLKRYKASVLKDAVEGRFGLQGTMDLDPDEIGANLRERLSAERLRVWQERIGLVKASRYREPPQPKSSTCRPLPPGWTWATLDELSRGDRPCAYGVLQPGDDLVEGVPFVRVGDINEGTVALGQLKRIDPAIAAQYPRTRLEGGEFLITLVGSIGRTAIVQPELVGANVARAVGVVPLTPLVNSRWVEIWFRSPDQLRLMNGQAHEVARKTLNLEDVRNALVALPPLLEQDRLVREVDARLSILDSMARDVEKALLKATQLRSAVLQKSFGGSNSGSD